MRLVLASASPRRAELLRAAGFRFEIVSTNVDERAREGESPAEYVRRLAGDKSRAAQALSPEGAIVLGADTTVVVDGVILGKPVDDADAAGMLRRLSGRWHEVLTGVSLRCGDAHEDEVATTRVQFASLTADEIRSYVTSGDGRDKAGAYAIQGLASRFIPRIEGSYANVVGLPVALVRELLKRLETRYSVP